MWISSWKICNNQHTEIAKCVPRDWRNLQHWWVTRCKASSRQRWVLKYCFNKSHYFKWINFPPKIEKRVLSLFQKTSIKSVHGMYWCNCCDYLFEKKLQFIVKHPYFFVRGSISLCERIVFDVVQSLLTHLVINTTFHCNYQLQAYIYSNKTSVFAWPKQKQKKKP